MNVLELQAMADYVKTASGPGVLGRLAYRATSGAGRGALLGAGTGAVAGAAQGAVDEDGSMAGGALRGALAGGILGGAVGGAGRVVRDARLLNPDKSGLRAVGAHVGSGAARFAGRQAHALTGTLKDKNLGLRGTEWAKEKNRLAKLRLGEDLKHRVADPTKLRSQYRSTLESNLREGELGQEAKDLGLTSLSGVAKGLATKPKETAKGLWRQVKGGGGTGMAALNVGLPVAFGAADLAKGDESAEGGLTKKQKLLRTAGQVGGGLLTPGMPVAGMMVGGELVDRGVRRLGGWKKEQEQPVSPGAGA
jgi:hypothetical protein